MADEPKHWPTERMILEGHADYATSGDLDGLDISLLEDISKLCEVPTFAGPGECIPCEAGAILIERQKQEVESRLAPPELPEVEYPEPKPGTPADLTTPVFEKVTEFDFEDALEKVEADILANQPSVADQFHSKVEELRLLTEQMLAGPPIPPPGVSLPDLASLVLGAKRWLAMVNAQGVELSGNQEAVRAEIERVVNRLDQRA